MSKKVLALLACVCALSLAMFAFAGCSSSSENATNDTNAATNTSTDENSGDEEVDTADLNLLTDGTITFATSPDYPPFENLDGDEYVGFEIDLAKEIANQMGLKCEFVTLQFDNIIPAVVAGGKCDAGISAFSVDPERAKEINFSDSYYTDNQCIAIMKGAYTDASELNKDGVIIAVQSGTSCEDYAKENYPNATIKGYGNANDCFAALQAGQANAVCTNAAVGESMVSDSYTDAEILTSDATGEDYALVISQDNPNLLKAINNALAELEDQGVIQDLMNKWF